MARRLLAAVAVTLLVIASIGTASLKAQSIRGSKHDLSGMDPSWFGPVRDEVCIYCHTPHSASKDPRLNGAPLWNRFATNATFIPYGSATITNQCPAAPGPMSLVCLSCHDGAYDGGVTYGGDGSGSKHGLINDFYGRAGTLPAIADCKACHEGGGTGPAKTWISANGIGTNLSNDHPISMVYPTAGQNPLITQPPTPTGWPDAGSQVGSGLRLYSGRIECPTCHNVHNPRHAPFLRSPNDNSAMCLTCHIK